MYILSNRLLQFTVHDTKMILIRAFDATGAILFRIFKSYIYKFDDLSTRTMEISEINVALFDYAFIRNPIASQYNSC